MTTQRKRPTAVEGSRRSRARTGFLSREEILGAALAVAERGELDHLTMRGLAEEIGVSAMALYAHVADKDDILDSLTEHYLRAGGLPAPDLDWVAWLTDAALRLRTLLITYPAVLDRYCRRPVGVPAAVQRMEAALAVLVRSGFPERSAVEVFAAVHTYTIGFAALETARARQAASSSPGDAGRKVQRSDWPTTFAGLDPTEYPHSARLRPDLAAFTSSAQFSFGLAALLDGLRVHQAGPPRGDDGARRRRGAPRPR